MPTTGIKQTSEEFEQISRPMIERSASKQLWTTNGRGKAKYAQLVKTKLEINQTFVSVSCCQISIHLRSSEKISLINFEYRPSTRTFETSNKE
jgi:hypothetical protein